MKGFFATKRKLANIFLGTLNSFGEMIYNIDFEKMAERGRTMLVGNQPCAEYTFSNQTLIHEGDPEKPTARMIVELKVTIVDLKPGEEPRVEIITDPAIIKQVKN